MLNRRRFTHLALVLPTVLASPAVLAKRPKKTNSVIVIGEELPGLQLRSRQKNMALQQ